MPQYERYQYPGVSASMAHTDNTETQAPDRWGWAEGAGTVQSEDDVINEIGLTDN